MSYYWYIKGVSIYFFFVENPDTHQNGNYAVSTSGYIISNFSVGFRVSTLSVN